VSSLGTSVVAGALLAEITYRTVGLIVCSPSEIVLRNQKASAKQPPTWQWGRVCSDSTNRESRFSTGVGEPDHGSSKRLLYIRQPDWSTSTASWMYERVCDSQPLQAGFWLCAPGFLCSRGPPPATQVSRLPKDPFDPADLAAAPAVRVERRLRTITGQELLTRQRAADRANALVSVRAPDLPDDRGRLSPAIPRILRSRVRRPRRNLRRSGRRARWAATIPILAG
jgi:hypothetical protein